MAHEFNSGLFVGQKAWHGLGTVVKDAPTMADAIALAGMDWDVKEVPLISYLPGEKPMPVPGYKCLRRSDNDYLLQVCKESWTPLNNRDAFNFFDGIIQDGDAELDAAIALREGKRIAITVRLKSLVADVVKNDPVEQYLVLFNGHDGELILGVMFSNIRVVCANTLRLATWDAKKRGIHPKFKGSEDMALDCKMVRLKHTRNIKSNLDRVRDAIDVSRRQFDISMESYKAMAAKPLTTELFRQYLTNIYRQDLTRDDGTLRDVTKHRHYEQLSKNLEEGRGMDIKGVKDSLWGAFQAVTEHRTHQLVNPQIKDDVEAARNRLDQMWFGTGAATIDRAQAEALALL